MSLSRRSALSISLLCLAGCADGGSDRALFKLLSPDDTGVKFANTITTNDSLNVQNDVYVYNGAGVAVGDIDNDGLADIFFSGNMVSSRLYLNKGKMKFDDITQRAGVTTKRWATGASMVDINDDGYLDIYVSVSGPVWSKTEERANLLFINNRNRTFTEAAAQYGVADAGFSTHAVFLDYDRDGCLDLFLLNNSPKDFARGVASNPTGMRGQTPDSYNDLFRNDCNGGKAGHFTNVSTKAGMLRSAGYGLGAVVSDLNDDGWPDIYISNDGTPNDVLYVNNGDGTFTDKAARWLKHTSTAGMGVDIADFNNDGKPDILQVDMLPRDVNRRKRMSGFTTYGTLVETRSRGFRDDYTANSLQLSNGVTKDGDVIFSEIGRLAGVDHTDWSWSALFADFDNDGYKDIFISNGYPKAVNDLDYQSRMIALRPRATSSAAQKARLDLLKQLPAYSEPSYVFRNAGDLTFTDKTKEWGIDRPGFSYGAAYADLDNDGKLDLVVNNIDAPAYVYHNVAPTDSAHHYLDVKLVGETSRQRTAAIGARLTLTAGGKKQYLYYSPYRGYMSAMETPAHFGLGSARRVDTLEIEWPDGRLQMLTGVVADTLLVVRKSDATQTKQRGPASASNRVFERMDPSLAPGYKHQASTLVDYNVQSLLPYMPSRHGPPIAVSDVNGDGLEDIFVGGTSGVAGQLLLQQRNGSFTASTNGQSWTGDKAYDDWGALFFDANGDGLPDLYVASGGYQLAPTSLLLQDRLYVNKGAGRFVRDSAALPAMLTSTGTVRAGDFNGDGKPDLFVGGRLTPRNYPAPTRSYVLRNDGGHFTDVTKDVAPELVNPGGMITDALWIDFEGDKRLDLVTAGEWMPIQFYHNDGKRLINATQSTGLTSQRGWWYSLASGDFDKDGKPDLVAGNLGLNYSYTTSKESPFGIYAADLTGNWTTDVVVTQRVNGTDYPIAGLASLGQSVYTFALRFPTHASFSQASIPQLLNPAQLKNAVHYETDTFASVYLHNEGGGKFASTALPNLAQIAPIRGMITTDVDNDGNLDLIVAGNLYDAEPNTPRADAGNGLWLRGNGRGHFTPVSPSESGLLAPHNVSGLASINTPAGMAILVANTGDSLQAFNIRKRR
ncbi:MAG: VCBS repeat-containing protein [Gemmatimonadales bacterium]